MLARNKVINKKNGRFNNFQQNFRRTFLTGNIVKKKFSESDDSEFFLNGDFADVRYLSDICLMQQKSLVLCFNFLHDQHLFCRESFSRSTSFNLDFGRIVHHTKFLPNLRIWLKPIQISRSGFGPPKCPRRLRRSWPFFI